MKKYNRYIGLFLISLGFLACETNNVYPVIEDNAPEVTLTKGSADFSKYVSVGASFTAGFTDNALFIAGQENSFPNILSKKFAMAGGGEFTQPLMSDNTGGLLIGGKPNPRFGPRLYFNGSGPTVLQKVPTTEATSKVTTTGNFGVPGAKSFHFIAPGYGSMAALAQGKANPYFLRFSSGATASVIDDAVNQSPTFFTLSEIGGNDVLGYALTGGDDTSPITPTSKFNFAFNTMVTKLTSGGAKGVVGTIPYITSLPHFTTVPYNPLDPTTNSALATQIPLLNKVFGAVNQVFIGANQASRVIKFVTDGPNPVIIHDEKALDLTKAITGALTKSPTFVPFVKSLGLPAAAAPLVAKLLGNQYGKARPAKADDLLVLPSSRVIGTVNTASLKKLMGQGIPQNLAGQFSAEGITLPLEDKWVLTPEEQAEIKTATDTYNTTIKNVATEKGLAIADLKATLEKASTTGVDFDGYNLNTKLVTGGLVSLDGVHLTARGYALMANEILKAIDKTYGSNFGEATNGLAKAGDYPTNYSPKLQ